MGNITSGRYLALYLPAFSYGFLYIEEADLPFIDLPFIPSFWYTLWTLMGAVVLNSIFKSIYGRGGPENRPKKTKVSFYYIMGLMVDYYPREYQKEKSLSENVFELISSISSYARTTFFSVILIPYYVLTWVSVVFLFQHIGNASGQSAYIGGTLLILQTTFLIRSKLDRCPPAPSPDIVGTEDTPEYIRWKEAINERGKSENQRRLDEFDS